MAAFRLLEEAQKYLPGDPQLAQLAEGLAHVVSVRSSPPGASVEIKDYLSPDDAWLPLGTTPLDKVRIPSGYLRWRVSKPGVGEMIGAPVTDDMHGFFPEFDFPLDAAVRPRREWSPFRQATFFSCGLVARRPWALRSPAVLHRSIRSHEPAISGVCGPGRLPEARVLEGEVSSRRQGVELGAGDGPVARFHRTAGAIDVGGGPLSGRTGGLSR